MKLLHSIHQCDVSMFFWFNALRTSGSKVGLFRVVSKSADGQMYILVILLFGFDEALGFQVLPVFLLAFAMERPLYFVLKNSFKRNRPQAALSDFHSLLIPSDQFSFPSGHTSAAFLMATLLCHFFTGLDFFLFGWAVLVGMSRVVMGVHFPTDTLAGATMGTSLAIISTELLS